MQLSENQLIIPGNNYIVYKDWTKGKEEYEDYGVAYPQGSKVKINGKVYDKSKYYFFPIKGV